MGEENTMLKFTQVALFALCLAVPASAMAERPTGRLLPPSCSGDYTCAPDTPENFQLEAVSCTELLASWDASSPSPRSDVRNYVLREISPNSGSTWVDHPITEVLLTDALPSTSYTYTVSASDSFNNYSAATPWVTAVTPACEPTDCSLNRDCAPGEITDLEVEAISCTELHATWSAPEENAGGLRNYIVNQHLPTSDFALAWVDHPTTEVFLKVEPATEYAFSVSASDFYNNYTQGYGWARATTPSCGGPTTTLERPCKLNRDCAPTTPENVEAEILSCSEVRVSWDESQPTEGDLSYYVAWQDRLDTNDLQTMVVDHPTTSVIFDALPGVEYVYYVTASDSENNASEASPWIYETTPSCEGQDPVILQDLHCNGPVRLDVPDGTTVPLGDCSVLIKR